MDDRAAELATIEFLKQWVPAGKSPICGNSIGQDRRFLFKYMPELEAYFHYRYLDVSTLKELARRWKPEILDGFKKQGTHQALDDIRESVAELAYYREHFIKLLKSQALGCAGFFCLNCSACRLNKHLNLNSEKFAFRGLAAKRISRIMRIPYRWRIYTLRSSKSTMEVLRKAVNAAD